MSEPTEVAQEVDALVAHAPALSRLIEEEPDVRYGEGDLLPRSTIL